MRFLAFRAKDLFSFESVELDLAKRGLVLVSGWSYDEATANGSGKSSLTTKGLLWALYGRTLNGLRGDDVCRKGAGACEAEVAFLADNNTEYRIRRSRNPSKLSVLQQTPLGLHDISCKTQADTQDLIDRLLGKDYRTFLHTDFFGQGLETSFMSLSPLQQNTLLETTVSLDQINLWADRARLAKRRVADRLNKVSSEIFTLQGQIVEAERREREQQDQVQFLELERDAVQKNLSGMGPSSFVQDKLREAEATTGKCQGTYDYHAARLRDAMRRKDQLRVGVVQLAPNTCPTCGQSIQAEKFAALEAEQQRSQDHLVELDKVIAEHTEALTKAECLLSQWTEHLHKTREEVRQYAVQEERLRGLERMIAASQSDPARLSELEAKKAELEKSAAGLAGEQEIFSFWEEAFKHDFKLFIFERVCPFLEQRATKHLHGMGQSQMTVRISTTKELKSGDQKLTFNLSVSSATGGEMYSSFSGGEQQLVSFAVGLAFGDLIRQTTHARSNLLILDEPFVCLDDANAEKLITYIRDTLTAEFESIFLISNESSIKDLVPNKIWVTKRDSVSTLN